MGCLPCLTKALVQSTSVAHLAITVNLPRYSASCYDTGLSLFYS